MRKPNLLAVAAGWSAAVGICGVAACQTVPSAPPVPPQPVQPPPATIAKVLTEKELDDRIIALASADRLRESHMLLAQENHIAGTPGDARTIERIETLFKQAGLEVHRHDIWPLLCRPISASLEITSPDHLSLDLIERILPEDKDSTPASFAWNAYSASGEVSAGVIYANFGTKEDFAKLKELGVDCKGKIILARYGGNYRGYKVKFAQAAGALGVLIYTDPADSGYGKGPVYPAGGYANDCCIQRGSILTLPYQGDPLTPGYEATEHEPRKNEDQVELPKILCQPIGYGAAKEILSRMSGDEAPKEWQGGLGFSYKLGNTPKPAGDAAPAPAVSDKPLVVKLAIKQQREVMHTANVIGTLHASQRADSEDDDWADGGPPVILGAHHDAWNHGAADPLCGTITVIEAARILGELAKQGIRPKRNIIFTAWAAEEFGIIGSTEWVESGAARGALAYINLDMASMGPDFGASATPSLRAVISAAAAAVPQAGDPQSTVLDAWAKRSPDKDFPGRATFGDIGGGSDHVAFLCHIGVPSCGFGSGGSLGNSYHSAYDTLPWYWKVVGSDYESAKMVSRMAAVTAAKLAFSDSPPLDPGLYEADIRKQIAALSVKAKEHALIEPFEGQIAPLFAPISAAASKLSAAAADYQKKEVHPPQSSGATNYGDFSRTAANTKLLRIEHLWLDEKGLEGRPWYKNMYAAPDEDSGYAAWPLPRIRAAIEKSDRPALDTAIDDFVARINAMVKELTGPN